MILILFNIEHAEMKVLRKIYQTIKDFTLLDWLFFIRRLLVSTCTWILSPILLTRMQEWSATLVLFFVGFTITYIFLEITKWRTEKSILFHAINFVCKNKRPPTVILLFGLEPYLCTVFYKDNYRPDKKPGIRVWILLLASSALATLIWTGIIYFLNIRF